MRYRNVATVGRSEMKKIIFISLGLLALSSASFAIDDATFLDVMAISRRYGVPCSVSAQLMKEESNGDATAIGDEPTGWPSAGLFQLMTGPNLEYLVGKYWTSPEPFDLFNPRHNATVALGYLADLHGQFGSWYLAVARYNCGPNRQTIPERTKRYARRIVDAPTPKIINGGK